MKTYYAAYGSNLDLRQMKRRCPTARRLAVGFVEDWTMDFCHMDGQAYATIRPARQERIPVLLWEIDEEAEKALDIYEAYPQLYYKTKMPVQLADGACVSAMIYIMNPGSRPGIPSSRYLKSIYQGYVDNGLDPELLARYCRQAGFPMELLIR